MDWGTKLYVLALLLVHLGVLVLACSVGMSIGRESEYYRRERERYAKEARDRARMRKP